MYRQVPGINRLVAGRIYTTNTTATGVFNITLRAPRQAIQVTRGDADTLTSSYRRQRQQPAEAEGSATATLTQQNAGQLEP